MEKPQKVSQFYKKELLFPLASHQIDFDWVFLRRTLCTVNVEFFCIYVSLAQHFRFFAFIRLSGRVITRTWAKMKQKYI